jgi:pyridoxal phosphate enzyme (YggS family)
MGMAENLASVRSRIAAACRRAGRDEAEVTLVAVTKTVTPAEVAELYRLGVRDFGENRVADGVAHREALARDDARWHLIGHLQRNKAGDALAGGFVRIHSVESAKLVDVLDRECAKLGIRAAVLLEANVSGEASKYGVAPEDLPALAALAARKEHLDLLGLMTMAPFTDDPETSRPHFRSLARLRRELEERLGTELPHLSMGMTGDFEVAVEEGATMVRVGTALFV